MKKKFIITCIAPEGRKVERIVFSEFQAFTTINLLRHEGCTNFGMREEIAY